MFSSSSIHLEFFLFIYFFCNDAIPNKRASSELPQDSRTKLVSALTKILQNKPRIKRHHISGALILCTVPTGG